MLEAPSIFEFREKVITELIKLGYVVDADPEFWVKESVGGVFTVHAQIKFQGDPTEPYRVRMTVDFNRGDPAYTHDDALVFALLGMKATLKTYGFRQIQV